MSKQEDEDGADIDAEELDTPLRGKADRAEERPRCAIDGKAERIRQRAWRLGYLLAALVTDACNGKQERDVDQGGRQDDPATQRSAPSLQLFHVFAPILIPLPKQ